MPHLLELVKLDTRSCLSGDTVDACMLKCPSALHPPTAFCNTHPEIITQPEGLRVSTSC